MRQRKTNLVRNRQLGRLLALLTLAVAGCDLPGRPDPKHQEGERKADFSSLFEENCAGCHGRKGELGPAPPLNDPLFLALVPDTELLMVISQGRPGTLMPAWAKHNGGPLTVEEVSALADGIKKKWQPSAKSSGVPSLVGSPGDRAAGEQVFQRACAGCHGDNGRGGEKGAINDVAFLSLISDQALRRLVITGRPDLGMPSYQQDMGRGKDFKPLTNQDVANVVALLASWRQATSFAGK